MVPWILAGPPIPTSTGVRSFRWCNLSSNIIQSSFASGELSPTLFARVDLTKYHTGAATMRNFFVDYRSGASTRTGTEFIRPATIASRIRLVRFQQDVNTTYILEFSEQL